MDETIPILEEAPETRGIPSRTQPIRVVCLGASAGGLEALQEFFQAIPVDLGVSYVVVVHLSPDFKSLMPELLSKQTTMPVQAVSGTMVLSPDHVYLIPPGQNMTYFNGALQLEPQDRAPGHGLNLPIDICLRSLAESIGEQCVAIILSGTGSDGSRGVCSVKERGGVIFAQSPETARFDGMPTSALQTGLVDGTDAPGELAGRVAQLLRQAVPSLPLGDEEEADEAVRAVFSTIKEVTRLDMSYLRSPMVTRRIRRRMAIEGFSSLPLYIERLGEDEAEVEQLTRDLLIGVTSFFRDQQAFAVLRDKIIPDLLMNVPPDEAIRVWVAACSTGCEVYSLAILLQEGIRAAGISREVKVFATDVDRAALERASRGLYTSSEIADVPPHYLSRYFEHDGSRYLVRPELRDSVIFARHNLVTDPPFTRMHLVSCRNFLIYLKSKMQLQVLSTLFTALKPDVGVLFLGAAEWASPIENGLACLDRKSKIYKRTGELPYFSKTQRFLNEPLSVIKVAPQPKRSQESQTQSQLGLLRVVLETFFEAESQSAALITPESKLIEVLTDPIEAFRFPKGKPTDDLGRIFEGQLMAAVSAAQQQIRIGKASASFAAHDPTQEGKIGCVVALHTLPLVQGNHAATLLLVLKRPEERQPDFDVQSMDSAASERILSLERELRQTKESLQATIEELQSSSEEQQSTNEELLASNEELQSTNEELQSTNEELYTVNVEYNKKNQELQVLTADLNNLLDSIDIATLYLDQQLRIRRFTSTITNIIPLQSSDLGRPITDFARSLDTDLVAATQMVLSSDQPHEQEMIREGGGWVLMRLYPYNGPSGLERGVLVTFLDVTRIKNAEETARVMSERVAQKNLALTSKTEQLEDLFSIVAHDLKRPVLALDSVLKLARQSLDHGRDAIPKYLDQALNAVEHLRRMLKDLSEISQLSHYDPEPETVDLGPWLDTLMTPFREQAETRGARMGWVSDHGEAKFARGAVESILNNLVENALVHGCGNAHPRIDVACHIDRDKLRVSVSDNGRGIAPEHHERIFEIFRRLSPDETEGSGVGLVGARRSAQRARGNVWVESDLGRGAKFIAEIPMSNKAGEVQPRDSILLVEDDSLDAKRVRMSLQNHKVRWARTVAEAADELETHRFDLILLDLSLPDGHGLKLLPMLDDLKLRPPVLVLSGHLEGLPKEALGAGMVAGTFLKDQIETPSFHSAVRHALLSNRSVAL